MIEAIRTRVSVRAWEDKEVEPEKLNEILQAAMQAPSAGNQQPWDFYVVRDKDILKRLATISPYSGCLERAPLAIVNVCDPEGKRFAEVSGVDMAICTEHEWLQATELGLGAVWIGVAPFADRIQKAGEILGLTGKKYVFSILPVGYPAKKKEPVTRFDASRIHEI